MTMTATTTTATTNKKATHLRLHHSIFAKYQRLSYGLFTLPPTVNVELIQMFNLCFFGFLFPRSCLPLYIAQHEFINSFHDLSVFSLIILCSIAEKNLTEHVVTIFRMKMKTTTTMTTTRAKKIKHHKFPNIKGTKNVNMCGFVIWKDSSSRIVVSPFCTFLRAATNRLIPTISSDYNILLLNTFHVDNIAGRKHFFSATHRTHHCSPHLTPISKVSIEFSAIFIHCSQSNAIFFSSKTPSSVKQAFCCWLNAIQSELRKPLHFSFGKISAVTPKSTKERHSLHLCSIFSTVSYTLFTCAYSEGILIQITWRLKNIVWVLAALCSAIVYPHILMPFIIVISGFLLYLFEGGVKFKHEENLGFFAQCDLWVWTNYTFCVQIQNH